MLRPKQFLAMKKEAQRGLQRYLTGAGLENKTLGSYVYLSSEPLYEAIAVNFLIIRCMVTQSPVRLTLCDEATL
ncbi:unnamed protein product [Gongylonema pulchrum]|uniref:Ribonuclease H n=1 Tax=Gongylonema pulchrum TaxID=637853 RepID=A0A183DW97_9BILA|nr:unnamed protein product [Gongylonema pulchrum]